MNALVNTVITCEMQLLKKLELAARHMFECCQKSDGVADSIAALEQVLAGLDALRAPIQTAIQPKKTGPKLGRPRAVDSEESPRLNAYAALQDFVYRYPHLSLDALMAAVRPYLDQGQPRVEGLAVHGLHEPIAIPHVLWEYLEIVTGKPILNRPQYFVPEAP